MFKFKTEPYAHQLKAFERFKDADIFALFMDMGTGKTKTTIDIAAYKYQQGQIDSMLILAPNHVHTQWIKEQLPLHCAIPYRGFVWESAKVGRSLYTKQLNDFIINPELGFKVLAANIEAFQSDTIVPYIARFVKLNKVLIIIDEATRIKNSNAKRTKTVHKLVKYGQRGILTGTPTAKSPFDLWSMMEFLKENYFNCNYFIFQHRYGIMMKGVNDYSGKKYNTLIDEKTFSIIKSKLNKIKTQRGGQLMPADYEEVADIMSVTEKNVRFIESSPQYVKYKRLDELRDYIAKDTFSVRKEDCLDLPPKIYEQIYVTMNLEQKRIYKSLKEDLMAEYAGKEVTVANKIALTTRLAQVLGGFFPYMEEELHHNGREWYSKYVGAGQLIGSSNVKLEALRSDLDEVGEHIKPIIWAHFVPELKYIYEALKKDYKCALFYGGTPNHERHKIIEDFQCGRYDIFIGNTATAGFGLNLQISTLQYYFSNDFRTENRLQAEDRSHRIGVKVPVVYKDIIVKGTVDEKIYKSIATGRDLNDFFKAVSLQELFEEED